MVMANPLTGQSSDELCAISSGGSHQQRHPDHVLRASASPASPAISIAHALHNTFVLGFV